MAAATAKQHGVAAAGDDKGWRARRRGGGYCASIFPRWVSRSTVVASRVLYRRYICLRLLLPAALYAVPACCSCLVSYI